MTRDLGLLPGGQRGVRAPKQVGALLLKPREFARDVDVIAFGRSAKFRDTVLKFGDRLLEFEIGYHRNALTPLSVARKWMPLVHQRDEPRCIYMRIDLGRGDVRVAEQCLQHPQVGATFEQVRGKGVA